MPLFSLFSLLRPLHMGLSAAIMSANQLKFCSSLAVGFQFLGNGQMYVAPSGPFDAADHERLETDVLHGGDIMAQDVFNHSALAVRGHPDDGFVFAAVFLVGRV